MKPERMEIGVLYGFRALMVLFVANYHIWQQGWLSQNINLFGVSIGFDYFTRSSYLFVDGMILLSGFLLYLPYARARIEGTELPQTRAFYVKRATRLLPSYYFAVLAALVLIALPQNAYRDAGELWTDLLTHLTLTFTFTSRTYLATPLGGALWTIAIEAQLYLVFPLFARRKRLMPTIAVMLACGLLYRVAVYRFAVDTAMLINQAPAFLDVYALGMLGAVAYCRLSEYLKRAGRLERAAIASAAIGVLSLALWCVTLILRAQSTASVEGHQALRLSQLMMRFPFALVMLAAMLSAAFMPRALRWLLDNKLMRWLSAISMNLYIWHQTLSVQIRKAWFTDALHSDAGQQHAYTLLCFCASILLAAAVTYGIEKPCTRLLSTISQKIEGKRNHEGPANSKA